MAISTELLLEIDSLNIEYGIPIAALAERNNIPYSNLCKRLQKLRKSGKNLYQHIYERMLEEEKEEIRQRRLEMIQAFEEIRSQFKVGQSVSISYYKNPKDGQMYLLKGDVKVQGVYKQFIVVQRQGELGIVKESINYGDIYTKVVEVKVI